MPKKVERFQWGTEFQGELLRFCVTDKKEGFKALLLIQDANFTLIEHQIITKALKTYYRKKKKVPSKVLLKETLRQLYLHKDYVNLILPQDKKNILDIVNDLYSRHAQDGESIIEECIKFSRFQAFKDVLENVDITDYAQYDAFQRKIQKALTLGIDLKKEKGIFMVSDTTIRLQDRHNQDPAFPTPYRQLNHLFDAGGTNMGNVIVIIGREKRFKTAMLVNVALGYLKMRKKVIYFDFENGEKALALRADQAIIRKTKAEILSGEHDLKLAKLFRKYRRLGAELTYKRFPAMSTTSDNLQSYLDEQYAEYGIKYDIGIIDYPGKMASLSGKTDDTERISDVFMDIANLADKNQLEALWAANHTTREAIKAKREYTKWISTDTAKCIDIARHVDVMIGLNQNEEEKNAGVMRIEMVEQRNGPTDGKAYFWINMAHQRVDEFTKVEIGNYETELRKTTEIKSDDL